MPNREKSKERLKGIKHGITTNRLKQVDTNSSNSYVAEKPAPYSLDWFDQKYAAILRGRNKLLLQGKPEEAYRFYTQYKDEFDRALREHGMRPQYYDIPIGIDITTKSEIYRFGWIEKKVDGNEDTVRFFKH